MTSSASEVTTFASYWIVQRADGVGSACTSLDVQGGGKAEHAYDAAGSLGFSEVVLDDQMVGSKVRIAGSLAGTRLDKADLMAGRWDGATFRLSMGDWTDGDPPENLCTGELGTVEINGEMFEAELSAAPPSIEKQSCPRTSRECRARLGDRQCRVDLRSRRVRSHVVEVLGDGIRIALEDTEPFLMGRLRWISGLNSGLEDMVIRTGPEMIALRKAASGTIRPGDALELTEGCDGRIETCADRFGNVPNFRGEPHLPGVDILTRYPGD